MRRVFLALILLHLTLCEYESWENGAFNGDLSSLQCGQSPSPCTTSIANQLFLLQDVEVTNNHVMVLSPASLYYHGTFRTSFIVSSHGSVEFSQQPTFRIKLNYDIGNKLTHLSVWLSTDNYIFVYYRGVNSTNKPVSWVVRLMTKGASEFTAAQLTEDSGVSQLCQGSNCYQKITANKNTLYRQCNIDCFDCLTRCFGESDCKLYCNKCYFDGKNDCTNYLGLVVCLAVFFLCVIAGLICFLVLKKC